MISEPFELLRLPKASSRTNYSDTLVVGDKLIFVGASNSFIGTLSVRPPQVLSAHSVPPGTAITAILSSETELLGYATKERNKYYIKLLQPSESSGMKATISKEVKEEVGALFMCANAECVAAVSKNTTQLTGYSTSDLSEMWANTELANGELVYSALSDPKNTSDTLCVLVSLETDQLVVRTVELGENGAHALANAKIGGVQPESNQRDSHFSFSSSSHCLYQLNKTSVTVYALPNADVRSSFELEVGPAVTGMLSLPNNNIVVARNNKVELIDCTFEGKISSVQLPGSASAKLLAYAPSASAVAVSQGNEVILGLTVTHTNGTLLESIGMRSGAQVDKFAFADIFNGFEERPQEYKKTATSQIELASKELDAVLRSLRQAMDSRDGPAFAEIVSYLKDPSLNWLEWHESGNAKAPEAQDLVYVDSDRNADITLVRAVAEMSFLPKFHSFLPQGVAVYLLTHPLFPYGEAKFASFLKVLERTQPLLYRQAIVSLPGITVKDLVLALLNRDEQTFLEAVVRLQEEFGPQQILGAIREAFAGVRSFGSLTVVVDRLSRHPEAAALIAPFVDAIGLLAWKPEHILHLRQRLDDQISTAQYAGRTDAAIIDACQTIGFDLSSGEPVPSEAELQKRQQNNKIVSPAARSERSIPRYSVETLVL